MVKKQELAVGDLTIAASATTTGGGDVLPCHHSSSSYSFWQWQWRWRSCGLHPRTLSFRQLQLQQQPAEQEEKKDAKNGHGHQQQQQQIKEEEEEEAACYKVMSSVDFSGDSFFASVDSCASTASEEAESDAEAVILQALRSDRLLYKPADDLDDDDDDVPCCRLIKQPSSLSKQQSINKHKQAADDGDDKPQLDTSSKAKALPLTTSTAGLPMFGGATAMSVDSHNPYRDFRESMEAMVMSQLGQEGGVKDWLWLEEMLSWYLRANGKATHGLIVAAFVDLLVDAADHNYLTSSSSSSSPVATLPASASATSCSAASSIHDCSCCSSSSL